MEQRWRTYMRRFRKTLKLSQSDTGAGLSKRELACGISFQQKLEHKCPHFSRMRALFEMKANVTPSATVELGLPSLSTCSNFTSDNSQDTESGCADVICSVENDCWVNEELTFVPAAQSQLVSPSTPTQLTASPSQKLVEQGSNPTITPAPSLASSSKAIQASSTTKWLEDVNSSQDSKAQTRKRSSSAPRNSKQVKTNKSQRTSDGKTTKTAPTNAYETRINLSTAYARNTEAKIDCLQQKLEEERPQWNQRQAEAQLQREMEAEQRVREQEERQAQRRQERVLELLRQGKSVDDIEAFVKTFC